MRFMRLLAAFLLVSVWLGALTGCGGGGGGSVGSRKVTILFRWPAPGRGATRVLPQSGVDAGSGQAKLALIEVFDGATFIASTKLASGVQSVSITVPGKALTFYVNAFGSVLTDAQLQTYRTDPATGRLLLNGARIPTNAVPAGVPVAHAVTVVDVTTLGAPPVVTFTLDNTISALKAVGATSFAAGSASINLAAKFQGVTSDGAIALLSVSSLTFGIGTPGDALETALENQRASIDASDPNNPLLVVSATGVVNVTVTDSEVNSPQPALTTTIPFTITPVTTPAQQRTLTVGVGAATAFYASVPLYTRSLTWTLEEQPLTGAGGATEAAPFSVRQSAAPIAVTPVAASAGAPITGVSIAPFTVPFFSSGRSLTLKARAWSNGDGTGALLAFASVPNIAPATATVPDFALASNIAGFSLSPPNPTLTLFSSAGASELNKVRIHVSVVLKDASLTPANSDQTLLIDPRAVTFAAALGSVATVAAQNDNALPFGTVNQPSYSLLVTALTAGQGVLTVTDKQNTALTGATTITVVHGTGGGGLNIN